jgi:hypothetical protein
LQGEAALAKQALQLFRELFSGVADCQQERGIRSSMLLVRRLLDL